MNITVLLSVLFCVYWLVESGSYFAKLREFCFLNQISFLESTKSNLRCAVECHVKENCNGYCYSKLKSHCKLYDINMRDLQTGDVRRGIAKSYQYHSDGKTFDNSFNDCYQPPDSYLAVPTNEEEMKVFDSLVPNSMFCYLDAIFDNAGKSMKISGSTAGKMVNFHDRWGDGEPNFREGEDCAAYYRDRTIHDMTCFRDFSRICQNFEPGMCSYEPFEDYSDLKCYMK